MFPKRGFPFHPQDLRGMTLKDLRGSKPSCSQEGVGSIEEGLAGGSACARTMLGDGIK